MKKILIFGAAALLLGGLGLYAALALPARVESVAPAAGIEVRPWSSLSDAEKDAFRVEAYARFPEILAYNGRGKFDALNKWMAEEKGVTHPNIRDVFRLYEDKPVLWQGREVALPGLYATLLHDAPRIRVYLGPGAEAWLAQALEEAEIEGTDIDAMITEAFFQP